MANKAASTIVLMRLHTGAESSEHSPSSGISGSSPESVFHGVRQLRGFPTSDGSEFHALHFLDIAWHRRVVYFHHSRCVAISHEYP